MEFSLCGRQFSTAPGRNYHIYLHYSSVLLPTSPLRELGGRSFHCWASVRQQVIAGDRLSAQEAWIVTVMPQSSYVTRGLSHECVTWALISLQCVTCFPIQSTAMDAQTCMSVYAMFNVLTDSQNHGQSVIQLCLCNYIRNSCLYLFQTPFPVRILFCL